MRKYLLTVLALIGISFLPVVAHDHQHPDLNSWFSGLKNKSHTFCCDGGEALHLSDVEWQTQNKENSHYRVKVPVDAESYRKARHGEEVTTVWVDVPDDAVIEEPNEEGSTLVWPLYMQWNVPGVRCFMPGPET